MRRSKLFPAVAAALALPLATPCAQSRPVAIQNARILTMVDGKVIDDGTVVIRDGKIVAVGAAKDVDVPAGARIVDARGGTVMPGLVSAWSRAGMSSGGRPMQIPIQFRGRIRFSTSRGSSSGNATMQAAKKVVDGLYARQDVFGELLECGVTTLALTPSGGGFPGQGAVLDPAGKTLEELTVEDEAFVYVAPSIGSKNKKVVKDALEKARKAVEERNKPPEPKKKPDTPAESKDDKKKDDKKDAGKSSEKKEGDKKEKKEEPAKEKKTEDKKTEEKPKPAPKPKKTDPNVEVLADVLEGKRRAVMEIGSATRLVHFLDVAGETTIPKAAIVVPSHSSSEGRLDEIADRLEKWKKMPILLGTGLASPRYSSAVVNPAANLAKAGFEVGFVLGDSKSELRGLFFRLMELVRHGLPADKALAGVTIVPAKALGLEEEVGSIAEDRAADLLLFSGDPLDPSSHLLHVWHRGVRVDHSDDASGDPR